MSGWICLHRDIQNHWIWDFKHADKTMAWIDMLMLANHEKKKFLLNGVLVECDRGELAYSQLTLAERWHWSRNKVRGFMELLKSDGMIVQRSNTVTTVITICNYSQYQDLQTMQGTADGTTEGTTKVQRTASAGPAQGTQTTIKQLNNENNENKKEVITLVADAPPAPAGEKKPEPKKAKKNEYSEDFEKAFTAYPKRQGDNPKEKAFSAWKARLRDGFTVEEMTSGVERYLVFCQHEASIGTQYVKQAATFFGPDKAFLEIWAIKQKNLSTTGQVNNSGSFQQHGNFNPKTAKTIAAGLEWLNEG